MKSRRQESGWLRRHPAATAVSMALFAAGNASAFEIETGNPDLAVRWDNTVRYNVAQRTQERDRAIGGTNTFDEGTYSFNRGDLVANRFDVLSELDFIYKKDQGFRVSAAAWYDAAYGDKGHSNPALAANASYPNNEYSAFTKRYYKGLSGEILDAFVFANFDAGKVPVKAKAGRHAVVWGESLFLGGALHSVSYAQTPLDLQKGFATPGVEAKELFRPLNQVSAQAQLTDNFSVAGQYFLQWEPYRFPEGGTYLGPIDGLFNGPSRLQNGFNQGQAVNPPQSGEYGLSAHWQVEAIDANLGFYYRRYADKIPQILRTSSAPLTYNLVYADKIDLFGVSLAKNIGGVSVGAELSYRRNTPLQTPLFRNVAATGVPAAGETSGARGDTMHGLVNVLGVIPKTALFDSASYAAELTWATWTKVRSGAGNFQAPGYATAVGIPGGAVCDANTPGTKGAKWSGCVTNNYFGLALAFTPTWYQVLPGVDLSLPLTYSRGLSGNAPTIFGGNEGLGNYSVGLGADIFQKHRVDLKYYQYFGDTQSNAAGTAIVTQNGFTSLLKDRGFVSLTYKTTF